MGSWGLVDINMSQKILRGVARSKSILRILAILGGGCMVSWGL